MICVNIAQPLQPAAGGAPDGVPINPTGSVVPLNAAGGTHDVTIPGGILATDLVCYALAGDFTNYSTAPVAGYTDIYIAAGNAALYVGYKVKGSDTVIAITRQTTKNQSCLVWGERGVIGLDGTPTFFSTATALSPDPPSYTQVHANVGRREVGAIRNKDTTIAASTGWTLAGTVNAAQGAPNSATVAMAWLARGGAASAAVDPDVMVAGVAGADTDANSAVHWAWEYTS